MRFASSAKVYPHADGTLQTYINHPSSFLYKLPDTVSYEEASLVEPLSVVLHASRRAHITAGQTVLVLGAGAVGLLGASVASAFGATYITVVDINQPRVDFAVKEGFANTGHVLPMGPRPKDSAESLAKAKETSTTILEKYSPEGYDVVLECTGVESCMQTAIHVSTTSPLTWATALQNWKLTILPYNLHIVRQNRRQSRFHWYGYTERYASSLGCCLPRSRHDWRLPLLQYLPRCSRSLWRRKASECTQARHPENQPKGCQQGV